MRTEDDKRTIKFYKIGQFILFLMVVMLGIAGVIYDLVGLLLLSVFLCFAIAIFQPTEIYDRE